MNITPGKMLVGPESLENASPADLIDWLYGFFLDIDPHRIGYDNNYDLILDLLPDMPERKILCLLLCDTLNFLTTNHNSLPPKGYRLGLIEEISHLSAELATKLEKPANLRNSFETFALTADKNPPDTYPEYIRLGILKALRENEITNPKCYEWIPESFTGKSGGGAEPSKS